MLTPELVRAGRALLNWSQTKLGERVHLSLSTIRDFEAETRPLLKNNLLAIQNAFENEGVVFDHDFNDQPSIRRVAKNTNTIIVADPRWPAGFRRV